MHRGYIYSRGDGNDVCKISKEEKSFGFCVFVYILCVFVYILCVFVYVFLGSQSQGSYISRDFVVDL